MISIPLYIFLLFYIILLAIFAVFSLIILYHIISTSSLTLISFLISFFVLAGTILVLYATSQLLGMANIEWQQHVTLFNIQWISDAFGGLPNSEF